MLCACLRISDASVWLPSLTGSFMHDSAPLVGKSAVSDAFSRLWQMFVCLLRILKAFESARLHWAQPAATRYSHGL